MTKYTFALSLIALTTFSLLQAKEITLRNQAKSLGLKAIPSDKSELLKYIDNPKNKITPEKVTLGKKLFFDPRLSKSALISCNTCHNLGMGGDDGVEAAIGHKWRANPHHLNSPTVYNAVFNEVQFWDGRSPNLEDQAQGPIQAPPEMAAPKALVVKRVTSMPEYVEAFKKAYGNDVNLSFEKIADTIAVFERTLVTPSPYDAFLLGKEDALNTQEKEGFKLFMDKGCTGCHTGIALGGSMQAFDLGKKYTFKDVGDFKGDAKGMVKVPTLRNIEETAPYYHNGKVWTLEEAVSQMATVQLGSKLSAEDTSKIVTFLKALTGTKPDITYPQLPVENKKTPKPDAN